MKEMLHHCRAVARGAQRAMLVGDMPFLSYQVSVSKAVHNAGLFIKEGQMDSVKLEGGRERLEAHFSAEGMVRETVEVYNEILSRRTESVVSQ